MENHIVIVYIRVIQGVVARVELSTTESRIVEYVQTQKNTALTRERAAAVCQTVWRQYRENVRLHRAGRKAVMVRANPGVTACLRAFTNALREQDAELLRSPSMAKVNMRAMQKAKAEQLEVEWKHYLLRFCFLACRFIFELNGL